MHDIKSRGLLGVLMMVILVTAGCVSVPGTPAPTLSPLAPAATSAAPKATPVAARKPGTSQVSGTLLSTKNEILDNVAVFAAPIDVHDQMRLASVDPLIDVGAITDESGHFTLMNLPPREYALAVQMPLMIIMPLNTDGKPFIFQATADGMVSLGDVRIDYDTAGRLP
jgi:hypothetical protein